MDKFSEETLKLYVATRLLKELDRKDLELITKQAVEDVDNDEYYYVDVYFPQIKLCIEIDEKLHKKDYREEIKKLKKSDIINIKKLKVLKIDGTKSMDEIYEEVDDIVSIINDEVDSLGEKFIPWTNVYNDSEFYIEQGYIDARENVIFKKIVDACNCLGYSYKGIQKGGLPHPVLDDYFIWFPKLYPNDKWENRIISEGNIIYERPVDQEKINKHIKDTIEDSRTKRLVFAKIKGIGYKFKGVYKVDVEESLRVNYAVYRKISDRAKTYENVK